MEQNTFLAGQKSLLHQLNGVMVMKKSLQLVYLDMDTDILKSLHDLNILRIIG